MSTEASLLERFVDLYLEIRPTSRRTYEVTARSSLGHQGTTDARLPEEFTGSDARSLLAQEPELVQALGKTVFQSVFTGDVRSVYDRISEARGAGQGLRLVLDVAAELAALPWEILHDPAAPTFLTLSADTPIVRRMGSLQRIAPLAVTPPLRILGMAAVPGDQIQLNVDRERAWVDQAIAAATPRIPIELTWVEGQTWHALQQALDVARYHAFHFIGHGGVNQTTGEGYILLATDRGNADRQTATELAGLLGDKGLRLVVLNACLGASESGAADFSSVAATLARGGIPAVLAMRDEVSETASPLFARSFYQAVASGQTVEDAVAAGREGINLGIEGTAEWATPVLYSRSSDSVLFRAPPAAGSWPGEAALPAAPRVESAVLKPEPSSSGVVALLERIQRHPLVVLAIALISLFGTLAGFTGNLEKFGNGVSWAREQMFPPPTPPPVVEDGKIVPKSVQIDREATLGDFCNDAKYSEEGACANVDRSDPTPGFVVLFEVETQGFVNRCLPITYSVRSIPGNAPFLDPSQSSWAGWPFEGYEPFNQNDRNQLEIWVPRPPAAGRFVVRVELWEPALNQESEKCPKGNASLSSVETPEFEVTA